MNEYRDKQRTKSCFRLNINAALIDRKMMKYPQYQSLKDSVDSGS